MLRNVEKSIAACTPQLNPDGYKQAFKKVLEAAGCLEIFNYLMESDFFEAPAATRPEYHGCFEHGLLLHSLETWRQITVIDATWDLGCDEKSMAKTALLHDLGKVNCYQENFRWYKDDNNKWQKKFEWSYVEDLAYGGHGEKAVIIAQAEGVTFTPEEIMAIVWHAGGFGDLARTYHGGKNMSQARDNSNLVIALQMADSVAAHIKKI